VSREVHPRPSLLRHSPPFPPARPLSFPPGPPLSYTKKAPCPNVSASSCACARAGRAFPATALHTSSGIAGATSARAGTRSGDKKVGGGGRGYPRER
jgi:hypothetical protein